MIDMPKNYYNENNKFAAAWLRELIKDGHIAPGVVDERSIEDVRPSDLAGYTQCHFFAGIGVWSYALRQAGWPDDRPVWTGSCPCQPFSAAGKGAGFADERHLWPAWFHLITTAKPKDVPVLGEQVASKDGLAWLDLVSSDMEGEGYAVGAVDLCAAGVGAPHIRQRLFFVAETLGDPGGKGLPERVSLGQVQREAVEPFQGETIKRRGDPGGLADANRDGCSAGQRDDQAARYRHPASPKSNDVRLVETTHRDGFPITGQRPGPTNGLWADGRMADTASEPSTCGQQGGGTQRSQAPGRLGTTPGYGGIPDEQPTTGPTNGLWRDADWLFCRDGKWRPVEPGTSPLANGSPARVGRLRGYGNAINAEVAAEFIKAYILTGENKA